MSIVVIDTSNITDQYVKQAIEDLVNAINNITDDNINPEAGINPSKIGFSVDMEEHATRHITGGADPLPSNSVSGSVLLARSITRDKIGLRAIGSQELDPSAITGLLAFDTSPITYSHGETIPYIDGVPHDNQYAILVGFNVSSSAGDSAMSNITVKVQVGQAVICTSTTEDSGTVTNGTVDVIRVGFKNKYSD